MVLGKNNRYPWYYTTTLAVGSNSVQSPNYYPRNSQLPFSQCLKHPESKAPVFEKKFGFGIKTNIKPELTLDTNANIDVLSLVKNSINSIKGNKSFKPDMDTKFTIEYKNRNNWIFGASADASIQSYDNAIMEMRTSVNYYCDIEGMPTVEIGHNSDCPIFQNAMTNKVNPPSNNECTCEDLNPVIPGTNGQRLYDEHGHLGIPDPPQMVEIDKTKSTLSSAGISVHTGKEFSIGRYGDKKKASILFRTRYGINKLTTKTEKGVVEHEPYNSLTFGAEGKLDLWRKPVWNSDSRIELFAKLGYDVLSNNQSLLEKSSAKIGIRYVF